MYSSLKRYEFFHSLFINKTNPLSDNQCTSDNNKMSHMLHQFTYEAKLTSE